MERQDILLFTTLFPTFWASPLGGGLITLPEEGYILQRPRGPGVTTNDQRRAAPMSSLHLCHRRPLWPAPPPPNPFIALWAQSGCQPPCSRAWRARTRMLPKSCPVGTLRQTNGFCGSTSIHFGVGLTLSALKTSQHPSCSPGPPFLS